MNSFDKLFSPFSEVDYIEKEFDFTILPENFINWLRVEDEDFEEQDYKNMVASMCEYSCLYISMLLYNTKLKGEMFVSCGDFGSWEHYWIVYAYEGKEYILDLTLQQFKEDAPQLAISILKHDEMGYVQTYADRTPIKEYVEKKQAFQFYHDPETLESPLHKYKDYVQTMNDKAKEFSESLEDFLF